ncbi:unnamed protein product [Peronospora belbahrii]|uniref:Uncharacterized protein n=1 Tax=Peronospora belbahrii TaxID=622444 RepID=A0ABN8CMV6_9STRA|nr:unnamed protein product [Peronospora belbahrii]
MDNQAQVVVDLDKKEGENRAALALHSSTSRAFSRTTDCGELKPVKDVVVISGGICTSTKEEHDNVKGRTTEIFGGKIERQAHFNECIGGRAVTTAANVAVPLKGPVNSNDVGTKTRKRSNAGSGVTRATKLCKTKAGDIGDDSTEAAPKAKKPRKRRRADNGEDLMLALTGSSTMGKEQQTDLQLAMTNKKIVELDEKMAKMAKQRINLVKTLSRLEKTKEKLQKSQVLPPAKVLQFLDRETAFSVIFPSNRQAHVFDQCVNKKKMERSSAVATRYAPSRWSTFDHSVDYGKEKHAELAAVAAISMWKRASQQLFGLQRDLLLYRNSVLQTFVADDEDAGSSVNMENGCNLDNKDTDAMSKCEEEYDGNSKLTCVPSDIVLERIQNYLEVPDVVKRVFPNWHRDLTFLRSQSAKEIKLALEAMENAQAGANVLMVTNKEIDNKEGCREGTRSDHFVTSCYALLDREEERLACNFMAQVMTQLIAEKSKDLNVKEVELKQVTTSSVDSRKGNCQERVQHCIVDVSESEIEEEPYIPACEELPKAVTAYCYD